MSNITKGKNGMGTELHSFFLPLYVCQSFLWWRQVSTPPAQKRLMFSEPLCVTRALLPYKHIKPIQTKLLHKHSDQVAFSPTHSPITPTLCFTEHYVQELRLSAFQRPRSLAWQNHTKSKEKTKHNNTQYQYLILLPTA